MVSLSNHEVAALILPHLFRLPLRWIGEAETDER
jgi:hypothetical protein